MCRQRKVNLPDALLARCPAHEPVGDVFAGRLRIPDHSDQPARTRAFVLQSEAAAICCPIRCRSPWWHCRRRPRESQSSASGVGPKGAPKPVATAPAPMPNAAPRPIAAPEPEDNAFPHPSPWSQSPAGSESPISRQSLKRRGFGEKLWTIRALSGTVAAYLKGDGSRAGYRTRPPPWTGRNWSTRSAAPSPICASR